MKQKLTLFRTRGVTNLPPSSSKGYWGKFLFTGLMMLAMFVAPNVGWGQILTFDFAGLAGNEATANSNTNNTNLTSSNISRGAGLTASTNGDRFNATDWAVSSIANAVTGNDYMQFTVTPNSGFQFSVSSIVFQIQRSSTGFTALALRSSVDGYASNLDAQKSITDNTSTQTVTFTFAQSNSSTAVTYRLYGFAEAGTGSGGPGDGIGNDITVNGSVSASSGPNFTAVGTLNSFVSSAISTPSSEQNFSVSGSNLTADIVISPPTGYQVSITPGSGFGSSVTLAQSGGIVNSTIIYTRFNPTALVEQVGGNITITSTGATQQNVAVTGEVTNLAAGDIAFIAFQGAVTDYFRIVALNDIPANTRIWFTDKSWDGNGGTLAFTTGEGVSVWTSPNNTITKGTVIEFAASAGTVNLGTGPFTSGLGSGGEQLFAYQGLAATPSFVAGFTSSDFISTGVPSSTQTWVPATLTNGTNFVALGGTTFGSSYLTAASHTRSLSGHRTHIHTFGSLTTGNTSTATYGSWPSYTFNFIAEEPTTQPSFTAASTVGNNDMTLNFSGGNGTSYIVVMKAGSAVTGTPTDATSYTANTAFASGSTLAAGEFVVFNGTVATTNVIVTGLGFGTTYHYAIFAYNGTGSTANYYTASPGTGSQLTTGSANSTASDIIIHSVFTEPSNVDYISYQDNTDLTVGNSLEVAKFTLRDGGATTDADANSTTLNAISFTLAYNSLLRRLALYDGTTELAEIAVSGSTATFTGLTFTVSDGGTHDFSIRASFAATVTDNLQYSFTVSSATADVAGSAFAATDAGAAASSSTSDRNRIEVTATSLAFVVQPIDVSVNTAISPAVSVSANDAIANRDLDYVTNMTASTTGTFGASTNPVTPLAGLGTFSNLQFSAIATGRTIDVTSGSLTASGNSNTFNVTAGPTVLAAGDIGIIGFNTTGTPDNFAILVLKDLNAGTTFFVNDNEVTTAGGTDFADISEGEASFTVKSGQSISAGTVIVLPWGGAAVSTATYDWSVTTGFGLNNGPADEIYIYTATTITDLTSTQFIYHAALGGTGLRPSGLTTGTTSISLSVAASRYSTTGALYTGCQTVLLDAIGNTTTNWNTTGATTIASGDWTFSVLSACAAISTTGTLSALSTTYGTVSSETSFEVSGANMNAGILVTPPTGFEVSLTSGGTYTPTVTVGAAGTIASTPIYVRLTASATVAGSPYSGNIVLTSTGASPVNVAPVSSTVSTLSISSTGATAANKVYDATTTATISGASLVGVVNSDVITIGYNGSFADATIGTAKSVTTSLILNGTNATSYTLTQPTVLTADITSAPLTITGLNANNLVFNGSSSTSLSGTAALNGVITPDVVTLGGTPVANFADPNVGTNKAVTVTGYTISGSASGNYSLSQPTGLTADITSSPTPVITSSLTASGTYGVAITSYFITATNTPTSFNATGLPAGLSVNTSTGEITGTATVVGTFNVSISATNAAGTGSATLVYTISAKSLTVTGATASSKVYDRNTTASITGSTLVGVVGADIVSISGTGTFADALVGSAKAITSTQTLSGADAAKYTVTVPSGLTADITVKALTIASAAAQNKSFDGNTTAAITGTLSGVESGDAVTLTLSGTFASSAVGTGIAVTSTSTIGGADVANYTLTQPTGLTADITTGPTTLAIGDIAVIGFNSNTPDNFTFVTWVPLNNNTVIKFTDNGFLSSAAATDAGNGRGGENFVAWTNSTGNTIAAGTVIRIENGSAASLGSSVQTLSGISNGGDQIFAYQGAGAGTTTSNSDFGTNANPSTFTGTMLFGLNFPNAWLITGTASSNLSYLPSTLNVTNGNIVIASSATGGQYSGSRSNQVTLANYKALVTNSANWTITTSTALTTLNTTAFTLAATPVISTTGTLAALTTTYGTASSSTSYNVSGSDMTAGILVTPPSGFEVSLSSGSGYASSITVGAAGTITSTTVYVRLAASTAVGTYSGDLVLTSAGATTVNVPTTSSTVNAANIPVGNLTANNKVFDGNTTATLSGTPALIGVLPGDVPNVILGGTPVATFATSAVGAGIAVTVTGFTISGSASGNYILVQPAGLTADITATPSPAITSALTASAIYGLVASPYTITASDAPTSFNATGLPAGLSVNTTNGEITGTPTVVGTFNVTISATNGAGTGNAIVVYTVAPKALTVTGTTASSKVYDGNTTATITGSTLVGLVGGDVVTISGTGTFDTKNVGTGKVVTSTQTLSGADAAKYIVTLPAGLAANITPKTLTIGSTGALNKIFDGNTTATITGTLTGVESGDVVTLALSGTFASSAVGTGIAVTSTSTIGGADAGNYTLTQPTGLTADITPGVTGFTPGNLVVINVDSTTSSVSLKEYTTSGTLSQTVSIPNTGATTALTLSGSSTSEGALSRSENGAYLGFAGYRTGTSGSLTARVIARVAYDGAVDATSAIPTTEGYSGNNIRGAVFSNNGSQYWASGNGSGVTGGVRTNTFGSTTGSVLVSSAPTNVRTVNIFNGQLFTGASSGTFQGVATVGTGLPTTTGNTITILPGFPTASGPSTYGFSMSPGALASGSVAYVADDRTTTSGGIQKWNYDGTTWTLTYTLGTGVSNIGARGVTVDYSAYNSTTGLGAVIYGTSAEALLNRIFTITDNGSSSTATTLATASSLNKFRGIQFAPVSATFPTIASTGTISPLSTTYGTASAETSFSVSGTNMTTGILVTPPTGFEVSLTSGGTFTSTVTVGASGTISSTPVYVRLTSTATVAGSPYAGNNVLSSTGAASINVATASSTVSPLAITSIGATTSNKVYDGSNTATITGATTVGTVNGDVITIAGGGTFANANIGTAIAITAALTLSGTNSTSYSLTQPTGLNADITPLGLTISGVSASSKVQDGTTTATLSGTPALVGVLAADVANVTLGGTYVANFAQSTIGTGIAVTVTGYTISGSGSGNYSLSQPTGLTADITSSPSPVVTSSLTATETYGVAITSYFITASNTPTSFNATGLPAGLSVNTNTGEITGTAIVVGTFNVTISATNVGGTGTATLVYTIHAKGLTITAAIASSKVYDGNSNATITGSALVGLVGSDVVTISGTGTFANKNVGTGKAVTSTQTLGGADAAKYTVTLPTGLTADITPKALTIASAAAQNKVFDGTTTATITGTLTGVVIPDVVTLTLSGTFASSAIGAGIAVTSTSTIGGADAGNYTLTQPIGLTANINAVPTFTEVVFPQFIQGLNVTNTNRIPFAYRAILSNLNSNATYRFYNGVELTSAVASANGAGNSIYTGANQSDNFTYSTSTNFTTTGNYGTFTTDANGSYTGWFIIVPTGNGTRFIPGTMLNTRIMLNDGNGGTTVATTLKSNDSIKVINTVNAAGANNGTGLWGASSQAIDKNFVFVYDNVSGSNRPLSGTFVENDGAAQITSFATFYTTNVNGTSGRYGLVIPNTNANGVQRIEQRSFLNGAIVGCPAIDADGIWPSGANTVNPTGGTTAIVIAAMDANFITSTSDTTFETQCNSFEWAENSVTYTTSGTYSSITGCHAEVLVLTIKNSNNTSVSHAACNSYLWSANNQTYTISGTYTNITTNVTTGCQDTASLVLTINLSNNSSVSQTACNSYLWSANNQTYTISGTYLDITTNGITTCADTATLVLTINASPSITASANPSTISVGGSSTLSASGATSYVWMPGNLTGSPIVSPGTTTTYTVTGASNGCTATATTTVTVNAATNATLDLTAFIQGYYNGTGMVAARYDNLTAAGSPAGNATDVDEVIVELHNGTTPFAFAYAVTGMLQTNGTMTVTFPAGAIGNSYYIVLKHKNSLQIWSASPVSISALTSYNFSTALSQAFTDGSANPLAMLAPGVYGMHTGDINQDDYIDGSDYPLFEVDVDNSTNLGWFFLPSDLNGDTYVDGSDYPLFDFNSANSVYAQFPTP